MSAGRRRRFGWVWLPFTAALIAPACTPQSDPGPQIVETADETEVAPEASARSRARSYTGPRGGAR
jgi:hypothetical protein